MIPALVSRLRRSIAISGLSSYVDGPSCDTLHKGWLLTTSTTSKRTIMKMLHIVCGKRLEEEIIAIFQEQGIKGYTVISGVGGSGVTGTVSGSDTTGHNSNTMFIVALDYESIFLPEILAALKAMRAKHVQGHLDHEIPLKVFLQPCEIIM